MKMQSQEHLAQPIASELTRKSFLTVKRRYSSIILASLFVAAMAVVVACGSGGGGGNGGGSGTYSIDVTSNDGGKISPKGTVQVNSGSDQVFEITPWGGYGVDDVLVDGSSVGAVTTYTFTNVTGNHKINATFTKTHRITPSAGSNGSISPSEEVIVNHEGNQTFIITPDDSYYVVDVLVDGVSVGSQVIYTLKNVTDNQTISATFEVIPAGTYVITASVDPNANGSISPTGNVLVNEGDNQPFTITPDAGFKVADILRDGVSVRAVATYDGAVATYFFSNVTVDHTISATFNIDIGPVSSISSGMNFSVALQETGGTVLAWGLNDNGQLGDDTNDDSSTPVWVNGLSNASAITAGGHHALAIIDGNVWAWGDNNDPTSSGGDGFGALGNGTTDDSNVPVQVCEWSGCSSFLSNVVSVAAGRHHSMALKGDGTVWIWGAGQSTLPKQILTLSQGDGTPYNITAIATSRTFSLFLRDDGALFAFGGNDFGTVGDGTATDKYTPVAVCDTGETYPCGNVLSGVAAIAGGMYHSLALKNDGTVLAWGRNDVGQLGVITTETCSGYACSTTPVQVSGLGGVTIIAISGGRWQSYALDTNGNVWSWGGNSRGQLGDGTTTASTTPVKVCATGETAPCSNVLSNVIGITNSSIFSTHSLARDDSNNVWAWGSNDNGELGNGTTTTDGLTPVSVIGSP